MSLFNLFKRKRKDTDNSTVTPSFHEETDTEDTNTKDVLEEKQITVDDIDKDTIDAYIFSIAEHEFTLESEDFDYEPLSIIKLDRFFEEAARLVVIMQNGSASLIQRKLSIGYARAGRILDQLESFGIVSPASGFQPRIVFIENESTLNILLEDIRIGKIRSSQFLSLGDSLRDEIKEKYWSLIIQKKEEIKKEYHQKKQDEENERIEQEKEQIRQELLEKERIRQLRREVRKELVDSGDIAQEKRRKAIPQDIQDKVWNRDGGKCVACGSNESLEFDHIIPFSKGGANTYRNLQLLCERCNRQKSNNIGSNS